MRGSARIVKVRGRAAVAPRNRCCSWSASRSWPFALAVHLAFLVLLVPVGGAMSFLLWTGQDRAWRRMGARRRYESLRLEVSAAWTEDAVRERRDALSLVAERVRERESASGHRTSTCTVWPNELRTWAVRNTRMFRALRVSRACEPTLRAVHERSRIGNWSRDGCVPRFVEAQSARRGKADSRDTCGTRMTAPSSRDGW